MEILFEEKHAISKYEISTLLIFIAEINKIKKELIFRKISEI